MSGYMDGGGGRGAIHICIHVLYLLTLVVPLESSWYSSRNLLPFFFNLTEVISCGMSSVVSARCNSASTFQ